MDNLLRFLHPMFCWGLFIGYGYEAIEEGRYILAIIFAILIGGMSESFWRIQVNRHIPHKGSDIAAFIAGLASMFFGLGLAVWQYI